MRVNLSLATMENEPFGFGPTKLCGCETEAMDKL
jgi:hypothetical protein